MTILYAAVFLIFLVIVYAISGSRNNNRHDSDGYHEDPYYYYPNNPAPRYRGGYQHPYYHQQYPPQYQQQYPPQYQQPYPQQYQQPYQPNSMRPESSGNSLFMGMVLFMVLAAASLTIATQMGLVSASFTIGVQKQERVEERRNSTPQPSNRGSEGDYLVSSKDAPRK